MFKNVSYILILSLAVLIPFLYSGELYNGSVIAKQLFFWISCSLLFLNQGFKILLSNTFKIQLNLTDAAVLFFAAYFLVRTFTTPGIPEVYNAKSQNLLFLVCLYFILKECLLDFPSEDKDWHPFILKLLLLLSGLVQGVWGLLQLYGFIPGLHSVFPITGTFFNPAPYALYLAAIYPFAIWIFLDTKNVTQCIDKDILKRFWIELLKFLQKAPRQYRNHSLKNLFSVFPAYFPFFSLILRTVALITLICILLILPPTMNRASWIGVGMSTILIFNQHYVWLQRGKASLKHSTGKILFFSTLILISGILIIGLYRFKSGSSTGRLLIWEVTYDKFLQKPFFGHGVGRFEAEYNNWQADYFKAHPESIEGSKGIAAGNTKYCFNEYLELASEIGIFGLILFLNIFLMLFLSIKGPRGRQSPFFYSLLTLLICALVSFPFYSLPTQILLFINLAVISAASRKILIRWNISFSRRLNLAFKFMIFLFFIFTSVGIFLMSKRYYLDNYLFNKGVKLYQTGHYQEACQSFQKAGPGMQYNGVYLQFFGKALSMDGEYKKSLRILERARCFASDEVLYTNLGLTCDSLKRYPEAEWAYMHAAAMAPHKIYPLYLLANHYKTAEQYEQAITTAGRIVNKKIKIQSMATDQIIREMKLLIASGINKKKLIVEKGIKNP